MKEVQTMSELKPLGDNEIIKALESFIQDWIIGYYDDEEIIVADVLSLVNRQKAEIIKLKNKNSKVRNERNRARADAIKKFAERLKATPMRFLVEYVEYYDKPSIDKMVLFIDDNDIDNLVKEMVGEDK
jgi:hypothetical protein